MEVPEYFLYVPPGTEESTETPGALTLGLGISTGFPSMVIMPGPRLEKEAIRSSLSVAPTARTLGKRPGALTVPGPGPEFPAAKTGRMASLKLAIENLPEKHQKNLTKKARQLTQ